MRRNQLCKQIGWSGMQNMNQKSFPGKSLVRKKWSDQAEETMGDYLCGQVEIDQNASIKKVHQLILIVVKLCFWCMYDAWNFHFYLVYLWKRCIVGWRGTTTTRLTEETTLRWPSCTLNAATSGLRWEKTMGMWFYRANLVFTFEINLTPGLTFNNHHNRISDLFIKIMSQISSSIEGKLVPKEPLCCTNKVKLIRI